MQVYRVTSLLRLAVYGLVALSVLPGSAAAQTARDSLLIFGDPTRQSTPLDAWGGARSAPMVGGPLLDSPVSRREYRLGPGDVLTVSLFGDLNRVLTGTVTPEGTLLIPSVGIAPVLGLNLDEAQARVRELIYRFYRNVEVEVTLMQVRAFKVFLVGNVDDPGVRTATATTRVSEVVPIASAEGTVHRNIRVRRSSGDSVRVDLARFFQAGDLSQNPVLEAGDAIVVPNVDETVTLAGRVAYPGTYEYRPDDTLADLLWIANGGGPFPSDAADTIRVARYDAEQDREFLTLPREEAVGERGRSMRLRPFDAVYVPAVANFREQHTATILGEVRRPGTYPVRPDTTTVQDLVEMAGGFTSEASLIDAVIRRAPVNTPLDSLRLLQNVPPEFRSIEEQRILQVTARGDESNVVVDFEDLFADGDARQDQPLQAGDFLYVPPRRNEVVVLGAVAQPGILSYEPGAPVSSYVSRAGGFTRSADRGDMAVLKAKLGTRIDARDVRVLEPGDRIVVPFKEPKTFLERIQTVQGVMTTVSGFVVTIIGIERLIDSLGG